MVRVISVEKGNTETFVVVVTLGSIASFLRHGFDKLTVVGDTVVLKKLSQSFFAANCAGRA